MSIITILCHSVNIITDAILLEVNELMFHDVGKSAHLFKFTDGIIPLRHGTRGFLNKKKMF